MAATRSMTLMERRTQHVPKLLLCLQVEVCYVVWALSAVVQEKVHCLTGGGKGTQPNRTQEYFRSQRSSSSSGAPATCFPRAHGSLRSRSENMRREGGNRNQPWRVP